MILVGAVFVSQPADLIAEMTPESLDRTFWVVVIFVYYMLATVLPIDKLIGNLYPLFGFALLFMAVGILCVLLFSDFTIPDGFSEGLASRHPKELPIFPMMFVSIACGAISGFHATQSPMMARCLKNEKLARPVFYGAMVAEGIVALIWAAAAIAFTGGYEGSTQYMAEHNNSAGALVNDLSISWLGAFGGILALLGVVAAPITSGDTALRSARLIAADFLHIDQSKVVKRLLVSVPIFVASFCIMLIDFSVLWRYFAWCNQTLAVFTLWAVTVYLARKKKLYIITLIPAMFMTAVSVSYILFAPNPEGLGLEYGVATACGWLSAVVLYVIFKVYMHRINSGKLKREFEY
jgi:carbon starvation protein CstA